MTMAVQFFSRCRGGYHCLEKSEAAGAGEGAVGARRTVAGAGCAG